MKLSLEDLQEIQQLDLNTIEMTDAEGGMNLQFNDEEVMKKIVEIAKRTSGESDEDAALNKLFNELFRSAMKEDLKNE